MKGTPHRAGSDLQPDVRRLIRREAGGPLAGYLARFDPVHRKLIRAVRKALRARFPTANELAYDYSSAFVIGYSPTERGSDAIVSMTADANGIRLYFTRGASLPDPRGLLLGRGRQARFVRLDSASVLLRPQLESLMAAAAGTAKIPLRRSGRGRLIIKAGSSKQRAEARPPGG